MLRNRLARDEPYGLRLTLAVVAALLLAVPFTYLTIVVLGTGPLTRFDVRLANDLNDWIFDRPGFVTTMKWVSRMAETATLWVVVALAVGLMWRPGRRRICIFAVVTTLGSGIINNLAKVAIGRPRPVVDHPVAQSLTMSFPSGHTMGATVVFGALLVAFWPFLSRQRRGLALVVTVALVLAVAISRMLLGVHYLTDVIGGFVLGLAWLTASMAIFHPWRRNKMVEAVVAVDPDSST